MLRKKQLKIVHLFVVKKIDSVITSLMILISALTLKTDSKSNFAKILTFF